MGMEFTIGGSWWRGCDRHGLRLLLVVMTSGGGGGGGGDDKVCRWWVKKNKDAFCWLLCWWCTKKTPSARQQQIKWTKIQIREREIPPAVDHCAIVDCSIPPPQTPIIYLILGGRILGVTLIHWAPPPHQPCSCLCSVGDRILFDCWVLHP